MENIESLSMKDTNFIPYFKEGLSYTQLQNHKAGSN